MLRTDQLTPGWLEKDVLPRGLSARCEQHPLRSTCRPLLVLCAALKSAFYPTNSFLLLYATPQLEGTILHPGVQAKYRGVTLTPLHFNGSFVSHPQLSNNRQVLLILPRAPPGRTCGFSPSGPHSLAQLSFALGQKPASCPSQLQAAARGCFQKCRGGTVPVTENPDPHPWLPVAFRRKSKMAARTLPATFYGPSLLSHARLSPYGCSPRVP